MKTLTAVAVALIFVASVSGMTVQEQRQMVVGVAQDCKAQVGASDNDLSFLILKKPMTSKEGKCLLFCILENMGLIDGPSRTLKIDEFKDYVSVPAKGNADIISKLTSIAQECSSITDPDNCEMAAKCAACLKAGMAANKIKTDIGI